MKGWPLRVVAEAGEYRRSGVWRNRTIAEDAWRLADTADAGVDVFLGEQQPSSVINLIAEAEALLTGMQSLGLVQGEVISFMLPNWREAAVINLAAAMGGLVVNPIVPIYREAETRLILADCRSRMIFVPSTFRKHDYIAMLRALQPDLADLRYIIGVRAPADEGAISYESLLSAGSNVRPRLPQVAADGLKMVMYTSGTTGRPKAVLHSHDTLARSVFASAEHWGVTSKDIILMPSPVTHISGYANGLERPFLSGTRTLLMESWSADQAVRLIEEHGASVTVAATPFLQELTDAAIRAGSTIPSFRAFACGGAAVPNDVIRRANQTFAQPCAFRVYGSSEAPFVTLGYIEKGKEELAAATDGRIVDYDVQILDPEGRQVPTGEEGEIAVRGPALFLGYGDELQTMESFTDEGFFQTGDIGRLTDEEGLIITGRKKDLIIRGGENISPKEIEDALLRHPLITDTAVVAMPHERLGEGICAYLVLVPNKSLDLHAVGTFLAQIGLAKQKWPEQIITCDDLPKTPSGKVRKDILRAQVSDQEVVSKIP